eukprot:3670158-Karenia_brevis.AAC.1
MTQLHQIIFRVYIAAQTFKQTTTFKILHPHVDSPAFVLHSPPSHTHPHAALSLRLKPTANGISDSPCIDFTTVHAKPLKTLAQLLREFTTSAHKLVKFLLPPHLHSLFLTSFSPPNRSCAYGFSNRLPHTSLFIDLPDHVCTTLNLTLLHTTSILTPSQKAQLQEGSLRLKARKMTGHFTPKFAQPLMALHTQMTEALTKCTGSPFPNPPTLPTQFSCPNGHYRAASDFNSIEYTKAMWCKQCSRQHGGARWICQCGKS